MHYKYSAIMNIVFITMMFGAGLPLLFPLASFSLLLMYMLEKYEIYYVFQQPPAYDEKLNNAVLANLDKAPIFLLSFGYWFLTNLQMTSNDYLEPIESLSDTFKSQHIWSDYWNPLYAYHAGPAGSLLIMLYLYIGYLMFSTPISAIFNAFIDDMSIEELCIDEKIDVYQNCLDQDDKDYTLMEEENCLKYGMKTMLTSTKRDIRDAKINYDCHMQGVHTYDILRNPAYHQSFSYYSADNKDRALMITDGNDDEGDDMGQSDLVRVSLNLAFLKLEEVKEIEFSSKGMVDLKNKVEAQR